MPFFYYCLKKIELYFLNICIKRSIHTFLKRIDPASRQPFFNITQDCKKEEGTMKISKASSVPLKNMPFVMAICSTKTMKLKIRTLYCTITFYKILRRCLYPSSPNIEISPSLFLCILLR